MLFEAAILAALTVLSFHIVYSKLPVRIRRLMEKYSLATDALALIGTYLLLGQTLTALMAGAMVGILTSILLHIANNRENYLFLFDFRDFVKEQINRAKDAALSFGKQYRENKLGTGEVLTVV